MDYCTWFPEGWWAACCAAHDLAYSSQVGKDLADQALLACVANSANGPVLGAASFAVAGLMYAGVRLFGRRYYKNAAKPQTKENTHG